MNEPAASDQTRTHRVERIISALLRWGVLTSLLLLVIGTVLAFTYERHHGNTPADLTALIDDRPGFPPHDVGWLLHGVLHGHGQAIIVLGLVLLILTPTLRVLISIVAFAMERDGPFVVITAVVLTLLIISFVIGGAS